MYFGEVVDGFHFKSSGIKKIEDYYGGKYIGYFCVRGSNGGWSEMPVDVFYQPNPDVSKGHSNYFGMFRDAANRVMITNAQSAFEHPMLAIVAKDGEIVFSRYRHDYRVSKDGTVFIDGGRDYSRYGWCNSVDDVDNNRELPKIVRVNITDSELKVVD